MYETLSQIAQTFGLVLFVAAFALALFYALSPSRRESFEKAKSIPLQEGDD
jgi:cbb3-type cytochrome oxidase subunit 3